MIVPGIYSLLAWMLAPEGFQGPRVVAHRALLLVSQPLATGGSLWSRR